MNFLKAAEGKRAASETQPDVQSTGSLGSRVCRAWCACGMGVGEGLAGRCGGAVQAVLPTAQGLSPSPAQPLQPWFQISSSTHRLFSPTFHLSWVRSRAESHLSEPPFPFSVHQVVGLGDLRGLRGLLGLLVVVCPIWMFPLGALGTVQMPSGPRSAGRWGRKP